MMSEQPDGIGPFTSLAQHLTGLAWIKDLKGRYLYANETALKIFGLSSAAELAGMTDEDLFPPATARQFQSNDQQVLASRSPIQTIESLDHADGTHLSLVCKFPIHGRDGEIVLVGGLAFDITDRVRIEHALQQSYGRLKWMADHAPIFIAYCDTERKYRFVNKPYADRLGMEVGAILGKQVVDVLGPTAYERLAPHIATVLAGKTIQFEVEFPHDHRAAQIMHCTYVPDRQENGMVRGWVAVVTDVTERTNMEAALRESEARYRHLVEGLPAAVYTTDADGRIRLFNDAAVTLWGRRPDLHTEYWCGSHRIYRTDGTPVPLDECPMAIALKEGRPVRDQEIVIERPDGTRRHVLVYPDPIRDAAGTVTGGINMLVDITERKRMELLMAGQQQALQLAVHGAPLSKVLGVLTKTIEAHIARGVLASILVLDRDGKHLRHGAAPSLPDSYNQAIDGIAIGPDIGSCGSAAYRNEIVSVSDIATDSFWADYRDLALRHGLRACWSMPIRSSTRGVLGTFALYYREVCDPAPADRRLFELLAHTAALVIERDRETRGRMETEQALRESEQRFRHMADHAPVMVWVTEPDGRCSFLSRSWYAFTGQEVGSGLGQGWAEALHPEDRPRILDLFLSSNARRESFQAEFRLRRGDGVLRWAFVTAAPRMAADGAFLGFIGSVLDLTERREAEEALRQSEERLRAATQTGKVGVWDWDIVANRVSWTESLYGIHGIRPEAFDGTVEGFAALVHPQDRELVSRRIESALKGETPYEVEFRAVRPDGTVVWLYTNAIVVREGGNAVRMLGATVDVTERKQVESALRESEQRFRTLIMNAPAAIYAKDMNGRYLLANPPACEALGHADGVLGLTDVDLVPARVADVFQQHDRDVMEEGRPLKVEERVGDRQFLSVKFPLLDENGQPAGVYGVSVDVTEQKQAEQALRKRTERMRLLSETLGQLISAQDPDTIVRELFPKVAAHLGVDTYFNFMVDETEQALRLHSCAGIPDDVARSIERLEFGQAICGTVAQVREPIIATDIQHSDYDKAALVRGFGIQTYACHPLMVGDRLLGTLSFASRSRPTFDQDEIEFLRIISQYTAVALDRLRTAKALSEHTRTLEIVNRVGSTLAAELDLNTLVQAVTDAGREVSGAAFGAFFYNVKNDRGEAFTLYTLSGAPREAFANYPMPRNTALFGPTFRGEGVLRIDDVLQDPRYGQSEPYRGMPEGHLPVRSYLAVPVISRSGEVLGGLFFGHPQPGVFTPESEKVLVGIAGQAAIAIDNANLYNAVQKELAEHKRMEGALRQSEQLYRAIGESIDYGIWVCDAEGRNIYASESFLRLVGQTQEQCSEYGWKDVLHPDDADATIAAWKECVRTGGVWDRVHRFKGAADGQYHFVLARGVPVRDEQGRVLCWAGINYDISGLKEAQEALRSAEERLRLAVKAARLGTWDWYPGTGIVKWDETCKAMFGLPPEAETDYSVFTAALHPEDRERVQQTIDWMLDVASGGKYAIEFRAIGITDGVERWISSQGQVFYSPTGEPVRFSGIVSDITERKLAEEQLRRMASELEQRVRERTEELTHSQERLRSLANELTLTEQRERRRIASELHDYLAQLLVVGRMKLTQGRKRLSDQEPWLKELDQLLDQSLAYTRSLVAQLSPPVLHEFGLIKALRWLANNMQHHGLTVEVEAEDRLLVLPEDHAVLLYQSVRELLLNVMKHARTDRATVGVQVSSDHELRITVTDRGQGFPVAAAPAQEPLSRGYGLFSIRERMTVMGGTLTITSVPREGTAVTVAIPCAESSVAARTSDRPAAQPTRSRAASGVSQAKPGVIRVVLVDDHAMVRQGLRSILESFDDMAVVGEAGDGVEAVALVNTLNPDVVVMDLNMPRMDGIEATRFVKQAVPGIAVIGLSVRNDREAEQAMRAAGASGYLTKESAADQLHHAICLATRREVPLSPP